MSSFTIEAAPGTDVWRKPPLTDIFNAPRAAPAGSKTRALLDDLKSAQVSFRFRPTEQYDQAGLLVSLQAAESSTTTPTPPKWLKAGVELYNGEARAATVACDTWADWSLAPLASADADADADADDWVTVRVEAASSSSSSSSLWVYQVVGPAKIPLRQLCWVFADPAHTWVAAVEAYACRPAAALGPHDQLVAEFRDFDVQWA